MPENVNSSGKSRENAENKGKKLYLAVDSGGTKVAAVLYDSLFMPVAVAKSGSLRANTTPPALVEAHFSDLMKQLGLEKGARVEEVNGTYGSNARKMFADFLDAGELSFLGEFKMGLAAAGVFGDGILALSGTGATVFAKNGGVTAAVGGFGAAVSDEGSGYWIGREAVNAAIRDSEERGPATRLTEAVISFMNAQIRGAYEPPFAGPVIPTGSSRREELRKAVFSIYRECDKTPVMQIASLVPEVLKTAAEGDGEARAILEKGGRLMAEQVVSAMRTVSAPAELPVVLAGSVWRGNPVYFESFKMALAENGVENVIVVPRFEPVIGVLLTKMHGEGVATDTDFEKAYEGFLYRI